MLVVATVAQVERVARACARAWKAGVRPGMTLAHARAFLRGATLRVFDHDVRREGRTLVALARWAERFSPIVAVDGEGGCEGAGDGLLVDISGCEHLFGGEMAMAAAARDGLRLLGFAARIGIASSVGAAWAVARFGKGPIVRVPAGEERRALATLPVAALRVEESVVDALSEVAIRCVGDVLDLPRSTLPARYGDELLHRLDQALGTREESIVRLPERVAFTASRELPGGTTNLEAVEGVVKLLLTQLRALLERHESGLRRLDLTFDRLDATMIPMRLIVTRPTRREEHLWALLRPRIERLHMGFGVERVTLAASDIARISHRQEGLPRESTHDEIAGASEHDASFAESLDTLANRFGHDRVLRIERRASHLPEHAACLVPVHEPGAKLVADESVRWYVPADRPSRLVSPPEAVRVLAVTPDGPVIRMWRGERERRVVGSVGPERLGAAWWRRREPARDYFRVQDESGRWLWLYQDRTSREWFVHGEWV